MAAALIAERNRAIVDALAQCVEACNACGYRCNTGRDSMAECGRLCADCADICGLVHTLLSRESRWAVRLAGVAAQISTECAAECQKFEDEFCRQCVSACQASAERCQELAKR